jgi:hypothetical protein
MALKKKLPWMPADPNMSRYIMTIAEHLKIIPPDAQKIFSADTVEDIIRQALKIEDRQSKSAERHKIFDLVKKWHLPLKCRRLSMHYVKIYAKVAELKATRKYADKRNEAEE